MAFDIEGARQAGYSDGEIADYLGKESGFDVAGAQKAGYTPAEIVGHLSASRSTPKPQEQPKTAGGAGAPVGTRTEPVYDPVSGAQIGTTEVADEPIAKGGAVADELANLRDSFFTGVDNTRASIKTVNMGMVAKRMQATGERLKELEARGEGDSVAARQMRDELASAKGQLPRALGEMTEAQGDAQRGAALSTRPAVAKVNAAKTFGEAWEAFKEAPYDVIAGVTATSLPSTLPALAAAAVLGPGAGAVAMGSSSAAVEGGSSLADFARDAGVDVTNAKAVEAFFTNPENLSAAMTYAGKRAGIIGTLDAVSGGLAGKTIAPVMKSKIARQAVNLPTQMAVQASLGAGGEALGQLATKGEIDQPGQVLMEAAGELGGAPMEVAAFSKEARDAMRPAAPAPRVDHIAEIVKAPTVDQAIVAAKAAVTSSSAVDNIQNILATQNLTAAASPGAQAQAAIADLEASQEPANAPAVPTPEVAAPADAAAAPVPAGDQLAGGSDTAVAAAVPAERAAAPVDQRLIPVSRRAASTTVAGTSDSVPTAANTAKVAISPIAESATNPLSSTTASTPNVQDAAPRAQPEASKAAPAQAPEARARAGVAPAAAGTQAGNARLEAARVEPAPSARQVAIDSEKARIEAKRAEAGKAPAGLSVGMMPNNAEAVTVKNGVVYVGKYAAQNFETGEDVTVPQNAGPQQIRDALVQSGALGKKARVFGLSSQPVSGQPVSEAPNAAQQRAEFAAAEKARKVPGNAARARASEANPFKAFLGKHGVSNSLSNEFAPGRKERQAAMVQGYGPLFRKSGQQLDALAQRAVEEGFLLEPDEAKLHAMILDALRGKRIIPQYAAGVAEDEMQARMDAAEEFARQIPDDILEDLDAGIPGTDTPSNTSTEAAMRALGFTDQEISDATANESKGQSQGGESRGRPDEAPASPAQGRGEEGNAAPRDNVKGLKNETQQDRNGRSAPANSGAAQAGGNQPDSQTPYSVSGESTTGSSVVDLAERNSGAGSGGLTAPTPADVLAQQQRRADGEKAEAKAATAAENKAKADAERGEFALTGSERAADADPNQTPMFSRAAQATEALDAAGVTGKERLDVLKDVKAGTLTPDEVKAAYPAKATDQIETPAFKKWFGDSVVTDTGKPGGAPLPMYHGTSASEGGDAFKVFDTYASNYGLMGMGGYFTADPAVASSYTAKGRGESPSVYKVFLAIKNPIDMEAKADAAAWEKQFDGIEDFHEGGDTNESWYRAAEDMLADQDMVAWEGAEIMQEGLRAMGFDGITHMGGNRVKKDGPRHRVYIAFDPEQVKSATGNNGDFDAANPGIQFSRAEAGEAPIVKAMEQADELFSLPRSEATSVEAITAENDPAIKVKKTANATGRTEYEFTMADGKTATMAVRAFNKYATDEAPTVYGFTMKDGEMADLVTERPGENAEEIEGMDDVWIDVSRLKNTGDGAKIYNIAATYAHNTGKIFIGDPAGLTDVALRRRTEQMISSALKFGTTEHLGPHPRQVEGDAKLGVPPLKWVYGDDEGNFARMVDVSVKSMENAFPGAKLVGYKNGNFYRTDTGALFKDREQLARLVDKSIRGKREVDGGAGRTGQAGWRTVARNALFRNLLQAADADGRRGRDSLLDRTREEFPRLRSDPDSGGTIASKDRIFYSEREQAKPAAVRNPSTVDRVQAAVAELIGGRQLPNKLGRVVAATATEIKSYWEPQIGMNVQLSADEKAGAAQAFYDPRTKTIFLIADHIPAGDEQAVAAHELMHKHGQTVLGAEGWEKLHTTINGWANAEEGSDERAVYTYARRQVEAVGTELSSQEMFPYAVEAAIKMGVKPSLIAKKGTVARWLGSVKYAMQQAWGKVTGKPETFKTQDLVDLAFGIAQMENPESAAAMGRITDTPVKTDSPEFQRWFGDSKVVDDAGKPLVVYHGTDADIKEFDVKKIKSRFPFSIGYHFTSRPSEASIYASDALGEKMREGGNVMPVYVSLKNPLIVHTKELAASIEADLHSGPMFTKIRDARIAGKPHDGIIIKRERGDEWDGWNVIAFRPEQIKSAIGNNGEFDPANADIRFSRAPAPGTKLSPWRDATGRLQFAPGAWLYDKIGAAAGPTLTRLGLKAASPELRRQLRQMKLDIEKAQETAGAIAKETTKLSEAERAMVSDLVEQELKVGVIPPAHAVKLAAMINDAMGRQTDELVALDMLTKDSADKWRGKYLPRYYESKLSAKVGDAWADAMKRLTGRQSVMKGIKGKNLKGRGLYETIPEDQLKDYEALGWEVRDPDYTPNLPSVDGTVQVWRDFTPEEREKMGEIRDAGFRFVMGYMQTQRDIAVGRMFERMASDPTQSSRLEKEGYVQVPTTTVSGTGAKVYGKLAGRWVPAETLSQLSNIEESTSAAWQMYRKAMGIWKEGKTSLNPVSHVNNMVSNLTMAHLAGVSYHRGDKYLAAARDFVKKSPMMAEAKENGLFLGTLSDTELMNSLPEELKILAQKQESKGEKVARTGFDIMTFFLRKPMGAAYQAEDTFFRYLIYKDAREHGMEPQDAVDYAQKYIFTYDDLPKGARRIRDFGIPFFSYTYKAAPALLHTALTHPVRMAGPAAVLWGINAAAYAIAAGDDDDSWQDALKKYLTDPEFRAKAREKEKLEREHLPPWNKGTTALLTPKTLRLGMDEVTKLPLFIDISRIIPGGDLFDVSPNAGGLPIPQPITPSHPLFTTLVAMLGNKDMFLGKEIVDSNDTRGEAAAKRSAWMWKQLTPAITAGNYHWERGMNALAQANGGEVKWVPDILGGDATGIGKDGNPVQPKFAAMQTFGIKVRPVDLETAEAIEGSMKRKMIRDIDGEIKKLQRLASKGAISDRTMEKERDKAIQKKENLRNGLTVDGDAKD
jgi:hypothetical protein